MPTGVPYPRDLVLMALARVNAGATVREVAEEYHVRDTALRAALKRAGWEPQRRQRRPDRDQQGRVVGVWFSDDVIAALDSRAQSAGTSRSAIIDEAIRLYLELPWAEERIARRLRMRKYMRRYHAKTRPSPAPVPQPNAELPPHGVIIEDDDGERVQCHACGEFFRALGSHVHAHGLDAAGYRERYGIARKVSLSSSSTQAKQRALFEAKVAAGKLGGDHSENLAPRQKGIPNRLSSRIKSSNNSARRTP